MAIYILQSKTDPRLFYHGTSKEIWEYSKELNWKGETQIIDGYPLPAREDIQIENELDHKTSAIRMSNASWLKISKGQRDQERFKSQGEVIEYALSILDMAKDFGPVSVETPEGLKQYSSLIEVMLLTPYFDAMDFEPVICRSRKKINKRKK